MRVKAASQPVLKDFKGNGVFRLPASWAGKMAWLVKVLVSQLDGLTSVLGIHIEEGET